jgi:hypothetical protein
MFVLSSLIYDLSMYEFREIEPVSVVTSTFDLLLTKVLLLVVREMSFEEYNVVVRALPSSTKETLEAYNVVTPI